MCRVLTRGSCSLTARWLVLVAFGAAMAFGAGCDQSGDDGAGASASSETLAEVRLGYFANVTHAQAVLGVASGDFQQALGDETKLVTRTFNAGPSLVEALFAGEIDIAYVGPSPTLSAFFQSRGEGIRVIAGSAANGVIIVAGQDSGIKTMEDLKGKRIATPQLGNTQDVSARHYLTNVLKQENTDNIIPVANAEQVAMMERGQIDAAWSPEPWGARLVAEAGGTIIAEEKDLWPGGEFVLTVFVVDPDFLKEHPDVVEKLLIVHRDWTKRLREEPNVHVTALVDAIEEITTKRLSEDIVKDAMTRVKFTDAALDETLQTFARWAYELGFSRHAPKVEGLVDTTILDRLKGADVTESGEGTTGSSSTPQAPNDGKAD